MVLRDDAVMFYEKLFSPISLRGNSAASRYSHNRRNTNIFKQPRNGPGAIT